MTFSLLIFTALAVGTLLGVIFFGGLWWTIQSALDAANPALWFAGSLLLRMGLVLTGFYCVSPYGWQAVTLCLLGFLIARGAVMLATRAVIKVSHAPEL